MKDPAWYDKDYFVTGAKLSGYNPQHPYSWEYRWPFAYAAVRDLISFCLPFRSVLEVGCATGVMVKVLQKWGFVANGIDHSAWAIENCVPDVKNVVRVGDARQLPWQDKSFDLVIALDVLEHIDHEESKKALAEMMRVAKQEVVFRVAGLRDEEWETNPNPAGWDKATGDDSHINVIRASEWERIIRQLGWLHVSTIWGADLCMLDHLVGFVCRRPELKLNVRGLEYSRPWKV
jgi:SAM-dependent methyltransferase